MSRFRVMIAVAMAALIVAVPGAAFGQEGEPAADTAVNAVLFFSPTCPHCEEVINFDLPPMLERFGGPGRLVYDETVDPADLSFYLMTNGTLQVMLVDVTVEDGSRLYDTATRRFNVAEERMGVPRLVVAGTVLVGSGEIPDSFPGIIEMGLAGSGIDWPELDGMDEAIAAIPGLESGPADDGGTVDPGDDGGVLPVASESFADKFGNDPVANTIAVIVLLGMIASLVAVAILARRGWKPPATLYWLVPVLIGVGLAVAAYLAYIEGSGSDAVCGPVGDCNAVQQSEYAKLFGIPIGVIGIIGYALMAVTWVIARFTSGKTADIARVELLPSRWAAPRSPST
ncbi:vitamin K epoxide reductase [bacterium]|nr:vitamin K epoxide reductase [bacterium]